ncbi:MAG TPA: O-antigen ligase family protein [Desulfobacterales bacterium]
MQFPADRMIWVAAAVAVFALSFLNIEFGLYVLIFSMLLSPEIMVGQTAGSSLGRGVTLRLEDFLLLLIGFSWFAKTAVNKDLGLVLRTPLNRPIFLYLIVCLVATALGVIGGRVDPKTGFFFVLKYFEYFVVFFVTVNYIRDSGQVKRFLFCLLLTGFVVSVVGLLQIPGGERVTAPFEGERGEPNTFGGYLLFMAAIAGGLLSEARLTRNRHLLVLFLALLVPPFLFAQSRSSYLAVVPMLVVLGYLMQKRVIIIGIMIVGLLVSPLFLPQSVKDRVLFTFTQQRQEGQIQVGEMRLDTSTSARINSWKEALADWTQHPIVGYGVTGYHFVDAQFPRVLVETGILGLLAFLGLLYVLAKTAIQSLHALKTPLFRGLTVGFIAGYAGLLVHAIGANTFIIVRIMEPFWFFAGIVVALPEIERSEARQAQTPQGRDPISEKPLPSAGRARLLRRPGPVGEIPFF